MLDLSKMKPNAIVKFRDGSITQIKKVDLNSPLPLYPVIVVWHDDNIDTYTMTGEYDPAYEADNDIVDYANIPEGADIIKVIACGSSHYSPEEE